MEANNAIDAAWQIRRVLVPLDGSERAERALPLAITVARATHSSVTLLRVIQTSAWGGPHLGDLIAMERPGRRISQCLQTLFPDDIHAAGLNKWTEWRRPQG